MRSRSNDRHLASHKAAYRHASEIPTEFRMRTEQFFLGRIKGLAKALAQSRGKGADQNPLLCPHHHLINLVCGRVGNCDSEIYDGGIALCGEGKGGAW